MHLFKFAAAGVLSVSMVAVTSALAAQPARPAALSGNAPAAVNDLRTATPLKHKSRQSDEGTPTLGYVLAAVVAAGIVAAGVAGSSDNSSTPASPG